LSGLQRADDAEVTVATESKWNVDSLHDLMDERDRRYEQRFAAQEQAVKTAQMVIEGRLQGMNEWRETVEDVMGKAMPRPEVEARVHAVSEKLDAMNSRVDKGEGKGLGLAEMWAYLVGASGMAALIASFFMKH
jgi:hypothetical protein